MIYSTSCTRCGTAIPGPSSTRLCAGCEQALRDQARGRVDPAILDGMERDRRR